MQKQKQILKRIKSLHLPLQVAYLTCTGHEFISIKEAVSDLNALANELFASLPDIYHEYDWPISTTQPIIVLKRKKKSTYLKIKP